MYVRMLRLRNVAPSGLLCFVFLEGAVALAGLLALAELVSWWGVVVLPAAVAAMVKLNDVIAVPPRADAPPAVSRVEVPRGEPSPESVWEAAGLGDESVAAAGAESSGAGWDDAESSAGWDSGNAGSPAGWNAPRRAGAGRFDVGLDEAGSGAGRGRFDVVRPQAGAGAGAGLLGEETTNRLPSIINYGRRGPVLRPWAERAEAQRQRRRQSAVRRYE